MAQVVKIPPNNRPTQKDDGTPCEIYILNKDGVEKKIGSGRMLVTTGRKIKIEPSV
jgi:hypothetical protein